MPRTDVLERIEIIDQMLQAKWSSYEEIIHGIDIRRDEKVTERTIQNYFKRIKTGEGLPQTAYEGLIYNAQDDEYDIIDEMRSGNTKLFKYKNNDFKLFRNKLGARITENLIPFLEYLKELHGLDNNFEEIVDTLEELVEREGFTLVKNHSNVIRLDTKLTYNLNNVQATNDFLPICRNAIVNKRAMKIIYQAKFNKTNELIVHPYKIVEYNNRWMFIAYLESITEKSSIFILILY